MKKIFYRFIKKLKTIKQLNLIILLLIWLICILYALIPKGTKQVENIHIAELKYSGQIHAKTLEGEGKISFSDGSVYQGNFDENQFDGQGQFISSENKKIDGFFEKGKAAEKSQIRIGNGHIWEIGSNHTWIQRSPATTSQIPVSDTGTSQSEMNLESRNDIASEGTGENK